MARARRVGKRRFTFLMLLAFLPATVLLAVACDKMGPGFTSKTPPASSSSSTANVATSSSATAIDASLPDPALVVADASPQTRPEHLVLRAHYIIDAGVSVESTKIELEREGKFRLIRRGEATADVNDIGSDCSGTLSPDVSAAIWKAVDSAAFVPSESGFSKPVQAPRQGNFASQAGQQARYSVTRMLADLSMVPSDENGAKNLVAPIRSVIATTEKQAASSGACTKLQRK